MPKTGTIDRIAIDIVTSADEACKGVIALADALKKMRESVEGLATRLTGVSKGIDKIANSVNKIDTIALSSLQRMNDALKGLGGIHITASTPKNIEKIITIASNLSDSDYLRVYRLAEAFEKLGNVHVDFKASGLHQLEKTTKSTASVKSLGKSIGNLVKSIMTLNKHASKAGGALSKLTKSIGRVVFYRAIRSALRGVTDAIKEGSENLYRYSEVVGTQFKPSMDSMATSFLYIKNSLATVIEPLVNVLAPVIERIADRFGEITDRIAEFLAALTGADTYSTAIRYVIEWKEAAEGAAKAAQKWLGPFDEINRLNAENSGRTAIELDYEKMFDTVAVRDSVKEYVQTIKDLLSNASFGELGSLIGGDIFDTLMDFDFEGAGVKADAFFQGILDFLIGFEGQIEWDSLGEKIGEFIAAINWGEAFRKVGTLGINIFSGIIEAIASASTELVESGAIEDAAKGIGTAIASADWGKIIGSVFTIGGNILKGIGQGISGLIQGLFGTSKNTGDAWAEALGIGGAAVAIGTLIKKITGSGGLLSAFSKKDRGLQKQGDLFQMETEYAYGLNGAFDTIATVGVVALLGKLGELFPALQSMFDPL